MPPNNTLSVGQRIRAQRRRLGMTQTDLSKKMGISPGYLSSIERGVRNVSGNMLQQFHIHLQLSYDYLLDGLSPSEVLAANNMICESSPEYPKKDRLNLILSTCSPEELDICYHMIHCYIQSARNRR
ncbi:MAG: helix-turn-helix domain-containing protein [Lachnospiraceae bacterium]